MIAHSDILHKEYGRALACYERALLFGIYLPPDPPPKINLSSEKEELKGEDYVGQRKFELITLHYDNSVHILLNRMKVVRNDYFTLYNEVKSRGIITADRNKVSFDKNRRIVVRNLNRLIKETKLFAEKESFTKLSQRSSAHSRNWDGLNNMCRLLMDEITYISNRVNDLQGLIKADKSLQAAQKSFSVAHWALWVAVITLVVTTVLFFLDKYGEESEPIKSDAELHDVLSKVNDRLFDIGKAIDGYVAKQTPSSSFSGLKNDLDERVQSIESEIKIFKEGKALDRINDLEKDISTLSPDAKKLIEKVTGLETELAAIRTALAKGESVAEKLTAIDKSIREATQIIKQKDMAPILEAPVQPSLQKAIINIERR